MPRHGETDPNYRPSSPREVRKFCSSCNRWHEINTNYQPKDKCPRCGVYI
jgi:predicted RNA-binding Zn-ribbon protein involved in translation (DUF1610 family)